MTTELDHLSKAMMRHLSLLLLVGGGLLHCAVAVVQLDIEQVSTSDTDPDLDPDEDDQGGAGFLDEGDGQPNSFLARAEGDMGEGGDVGVAQTETAMGEDDDEEDGEKLEDFGGVTKEKAKAQFVWSVLKHAAPLVGSLFGRKKGKKKESRWGNIINNVGKFFEKKPRQSFQQKGCHQTCTFIRTCTGSSCSSPRMRCLREYCYPSSSGYRPGRMMPENRIYRPRNGQYRFRLG